MKYLIGFALLILLAASCAKQPAEEKQESVMRDDERAIVDEAAAATPEAPAREAIYTYGQAQGNQRELCLRIDDEPVLIGDKYVVLIGVMLGRQRIALVEVGGVGRKLLLQDKLLGYRVSAISQKEIKLTKGGGAHE